MVVRWHSLPANFRTKRKNSSTYINRRKEKKKELKKAEEEIGLEPERVHARHSDLRLTRLSNAPR